MKKEFLTLITQNNPNMQFQPNHGGLAGRFNESIIKKEIRIASI